MRKMQIPNIHFTRGYYTLRAAVLFVLSCVITFNNLHAQTSDVQPNYQFTNYSIDNGLSHNFITSIFQDREGYIWIGGLNGIDRFDGKNFKHYSKNNNDSTSIIGGQVLFIYQDKQDGNLWVGNNTVGLQLFSPKKETFYHVSNENKATTTEHYSANCIAEDEDGKLWIGTDSGIKLLNRTNLTYSSTSYNAAFNNTDRNYINKLHFDSTGLLWIGTNAGVDILNTQTNESTHISIPSDIPSDIEIWDFYEESDSIMWIGTFSNGIVKYNRRTKNQEIHLFETKGNINNTARTFVKDNSGNIWIGGRNGIFIYNPKNNTYSHYNQDDSFEYGLPHNSVLTMLKDKKGDIWIGTRNGISHWCAEKQVFNYYHSNQLDNRCLNSSSVFHFKEFNNSLYIATESGGVNILNENNTFSYLTTPQLNINNIKCLENYNGKLWIGTFMGGVNIYDPKTESLSYYKTKINNNHSIPDDRVNVVFKDSLNQLWIGTDNGVAQYNTTTQQFDRKFPLIGAQPIIWITQDNKKQLWLASPDTIYSIEIISNKIVKTIATEVVTRHLHVDKQNNYWITTAGKGLAKLNTLNDKLIYFTTTSGLSSNLAFGILEDDHNNLWISTANGLNCFNTITLQTKTYFKNDGTHINQYNYNSFFKANNGDFLFGGINGFIRFNPDKITSNSTPPNLVISQFFIFDKPLINQQKTDTITLSHYENFFSFKYAALDYTNPQRNKYQFKLEGIDANWVDAQNSTEASYTKVPPGIYRFQVRSISAHGDWKVSSKPITIIIKPPFHQTLYFKIFFTLFILLSLFYIIYWRTINQKKQRVKLENMVREKTSSLELSKAEILEQKEEIQFQNKQLIKLSNTITQQHAELENYASELEAKVIQRTTELEEAKIKAEESDKLKSIFLANVSHEIRTPMNGILGFTDLLKDPDSSQEEINTFVDIIEKSGERMLNIINDLIDLSKIESNQIETNIKRVKIEDIYNHLKQFFKLESQKKGVQFICNAPENEDTLTINTDQFRLTQILSNIIANAFKFTTKGQITFSYYTTSEELIFKISDTGIGIAPQKQQIIFDRFTQIDSSSTKNYEGAGLGLFISKVLILKLGGNIFLESKENMGSTFTISLPLNREA